MTKGKFKAFLTKKYDGLIAEKILRIMGPNLFK